MNVAKCWDEAEDQVLCAVDEWSEISRGLAYSVLWILTDCLAYLGCLIKGSGGLPLTIRIESQRRFLFAACASDTKEASGLET